MIRKFTAPTFLALLALMLFACSPTTETVETSAAVEPVAAVAEEEVMAEEKMEEMAEESHDSDSMEEEAHSDEAMAEGEMAEGEMAEGEMAEGEMAEGEMAEGEMAEGEMAEGEMAEGEMAEGEMAEGEMAEGEGEMAEGEGMEAVYAVNAADSEVLWKGSKAVGDFHTGTIDVAEGSLTVVDGSLATGSFVLDMTSLASNDGANARLANHLKDDDFFGVDTHPTAMLVITSAEWVEGDQYNVQADLTIKDITNPIEFVATASEVDGLVTATADIVFDRAQFDVQYGSGSFFSGLGNDLINDEVEITVSLVASK